MSIKDASQDLYKNASGTLTSRVKIAIEAIRDGEVVLEIGVAFKEFSGNIGKFKKIEYYAVDVAESALNEIKNFSIDHQLADISQDTLKFEDNSFDAVVCLEVFEHLQNPAHALSEIQRVLKPGGRLIISVPNALGGHIVIYPGLITVKHFKQFLRQNFFRVVDIKMWGPVFNKDNVGELLKEKIGENSFARIMLLLVQIVVHGSQLITRCVGLKVSSLYWCYSFICENKKDKMGGPFWYKQLEQTSDLKKYPGGYHPYYHKKA